MIPAGKHRLTQGRRIGVDTYTHLEINAFALIKPESAESAGTFVPWNTGIIDKYLRGISRINSALKGDEHGILHLAVNQRTRIVINIIHCQIQKIQPYFRNRNTG